MLTMTEDEFEEKFNAALRHRDEAAPEEAIVVLERLLLTGMRRASVVAVLGLITYLELHDPEHALPYLREAALLSPSSELSSLTLFHALLQIGEIDEAFEESRRFLASNDSVNYRTVLNGLADGEDDEEDEAWVTNPS